MRKSTVKSLVVMIILLVIIIALIVILTTVGKKNVPAEKMGDTVIGEQAAAPETQTTPEETTPAPVVEEPTEPASVDLPNEKVVRLYTGGGGVMELVTEYNSAWTVDEDIATFEAFNTDEQTIYYDNYYLVHQTYWDAVETDTVYKIGYELSFDVNGENKVITIRQPSDVANNPDLFMGDYAYDENNNLITDGMTGYLGVWLYADMYHDSTYVHLTQDDMTDETVITSIKLRPTPQSDAVSNLKLKAFSYSSEEEFNSQGRYIGTHGYEITINNQQ